MVFLWPVMATIAAAPGDRHWAYQKPQRPALPLPKAEWPRNAIDHFVLNKMRANGLKPSPEAAPGQLLRRVHLDLIGLPPSPAELDAFLQDPSPTEYAVVRPQ